jgi:hypothetical protein
MLLAAGAGLVFVIAGLALVMARHRSNKKTAAMKEDIQLGIAASTASLSSLIT